MTSLIQKFKAAIRDLPIIRDRRIKKFDRIVAPIIDREIKKILQEEKFPLFQFLEIETINRCNGECSFCPVNKKSDPRTFSKMEEELFKKIILQLKELNYSGTLHLYSNNEPLLDKRIYDFAKFSRENLPNAYIILLTNGTLLDIEKYERLVPHLNKLLIDNYNDDLVMHDNVKEIHEHWQKSPPEHLDFSIKLRKETEVLSTRGGNAPNKMEFPPLQSSCIVPFQQMVVRPDGKVSLCSNDALGSMTLGNLNQDHIYEVWTNETFTKLREQLHQSRSNIEICKNCDSFYGDVPYPEWRAN